MVKIHPETGDRSLFIGRHAFGLALLREETTGHRYGATTAAS